MESRHAKTAFANTVTPSAARWLWMSFLIAVVLALPLSIPIGGYVGTFMSSLHTMFYFGLVEPGGTQMSSTASATTLA